VTLQRSNYVVVDPSKPHMASVDVEASRIMSLSDAELDEIFPPCPCHARCTCPWTQ
jgi:hypothetical protein